MFHRGHFARLLAAVALAFALNALAGGAAEDPPSLSGAGAGTADPASHTAPNSASNVALDSAPNSRVRIVRLSQVIGAVKIDRELNRGFENAATNLPLIEGVKLQTEMGLAEVEFEDNSSLRMTPDTTIELEQLQLRPTGSKVSTVHVVAGMVYVSMASAKGNDFRLRFGSENLVLHPSSHVRLQVANSQAELSMLKGAAEIEGPTETTPVWKKRTLRFDLANPDQPAHMQRVAESRFDGWDRQAAEYHSTVAQSGSFDFSGSSGAYGGAPYGYGMSDMNYYGSFIGAGGCGSMWRPYLASASWDPYGNGAWAWYGGTGYSWVSPYPWGWMPYHYGSWSYCSGYGWGWRPGGAWMGLANGVMPVNGRSHPPLMPPRPRRPPGPGQPALIPVSMQRLAVSGLKSNDTFVFRNDSAGLGVPRGSLGSLTRISRQAQIHESVSMPVLIGNAAARSNGSGGPMAAGRAGGFGSSSSMGGLSGASRASSAAGRGASSGGGHSR
jgi:hypothetical protein